MSETGSDRDPIVAIVGSAVEDDGAAHLLLYRLGSRIEIVVIEEEGADASMFLSEEQARELCSTLTTALEKQK
jgi:hypothetical protein